MPSGFLNIDKPEEWTSHDVVAKLRRVLGTKKIGHTGTLDPFATGVLPVAIGSSTRLIRFLKKNKKYLAEIDFSFITDTDDCTGEEIELDIKGIHELYKKHYSDRELDAPKFVSLAKGSASKINAEEFNQALESFKGKIIQIPPIYSAIKQDGRKLYEIARSGEKLDLSDVKTKDVEVKEIKVIDFDYPKAKVQITCSEGTYIRSIARDLGGHLSMLRRLESNGFDLASSIDIADLEDPDSQAGSGFMVNAPEVIDLPVVRVCDKDVMDLQQGKKIKIEADEISQNGSSESSNYIQCIDSDGELAGICASEEKGRSLFLQPKVIV